MFKRLLWLTIGASFGVGSSFWVARFIRHTVERYTPRRVTSSAATAIRTIGGDLRAAVNDGRQAMQAKEAALRAELETRAASRLT